MVRCCSGKLGHKRRVADDDPSAALHTSLYLDASDAAGFEDRQWAPFTMGPDRHRAYAVQWYGLCLTAFVIWLVLGFNAGRRSAA